MSSNRRTPRANARKAWATEKKCPVRRSFPVTIIKRAASAKSLNNEVCARRYPFCRNCDKRQRCTCPGKLRLGTSNSLMKRTKVKLVHLLYAYCLLVGNLKLKQKHFLFYSKKKHTCNRKRIRNDRKITHSIECFPIAEDLASSVCQIYSCPFAGYDQNGKTQRKYI